VSTRFRGTKQINRHPEEAAKRPSRRMIGHRSRVYPRSGIINCKQVGLADLRGRRPSKRRPTAGSCASVMVVLSAWCESTSCGVTTHVAEGNCVAVRRGGEQPEAKG
jgi:hypothetical protein